MKLIDKDSLVAEIERLKERFIAFHHRDGNDWPLNNYGKMRAYNEVLSFINTLEAKEVDLEKAIDDYIYTHDGRKRLALELDWKCCNLTLKGGDEIIKFAKHFFELGLSVSNKAQKEEKV